MPVTLDPSARRGQSLRDVLQRDGLGGAELLGGQASRCAAVVINPDHRERLGVRVEHRALVHLPLVSPRDEVTAGWDYSQPLERWSVKRARADDPDASDNFAPPAAGVQLIDERERPVPEPICLRCHQYGVSDTGTEPPAHDQAFIFPSPDNQRGTLFS